MNFEDLVKKINALDTSTTESMQPPVQAIMAPASGPEYPESGEVSLEELTAIKQLLGKMRGEEDTDRSAMEPQFDIPDDDVLLGDEPPNDKLLGEIPADDQWSNSPDEKMAKLAAVIATGDDLASKGKEAPKVNGGGNPMQESLMDKLSAMYEEVKTRQMSRAAKGNKKYGKDGMAALRDAAKDGASEAEMDEIRDEHNNYKK